MMIQRRFQTGNRGILSRIHINLYIPGIFILTVVILLMLFIGWSTWENLNRDRTDAMHQLSREADALFYALEGYGLTRMGEDAPSNASSGHAHNSHSQHDGNQNDSPGLQIESLKKIANRISRTDNITYVYYVDVNGKTLFDTHPSLRSHVESHQDHHSIDAPSLTVTSPSHHGAHRIVQLDDNTPILEATYSFTEFDATIGLDMNAYENARKADMHHAMVMIGILAVLGAGAAFFLFVIKKHLADLKRIQRLEDRVRKNEKHVEIGKLAAAVAHEIRNPLSAIKGFAQFLGHVLKEDPKNSEYAKIMVKELDRINRVITDLLVFARPLENRKTPSDIGELITHTVRLADGDSRYGRISVKTELPDALPTIRLDRHQMTQVLLNLLLNALRELQPGGHVLISGLSDNFRGCNSSAVNG